MWCLTPGITALGKLRLEDHELETSLGYSEFEALLDYRVRHCLKKNKNERQAEKRTEGEGEEREIMEREKSGRSNIPLWAL
jgi:hypothetical protein